MLGRRGSAVASARLRRILSELLRDHLRVQLDPTTGTRVPMEVAVQFAVASLLGLIEWWLDHDRPYSPEQLEEMYRRLTEPWVIPPSGTTFDVRVRGRIAAFLASRNQVLFGCRCAGLDVGVSTGCVRRVVVELTTPAAPGRMVQP